MRISIALTTAALATLAFVISNTPSRGQAAMGYPGAQVDAACNGTGDGFACRVTRGPREWPSAKIIAVPQPTTVEGKAEQAAREAEWVAVCKPLIVRDKYGVSRYTYDKACPHGVVIGDGRRP